MKVGDYVRTKDGRIFKWNNLCTTDKKDYEEHTRKILFIEDEIKSSPNIIDLINEGDVVVIQKKDSEYLEKYEIEEYEITDISGTKTIEKGLGIFMDFHNVPLKKLAPLIKSILTKEQFESMEYKVGD